jgi:hypothetical protein
MWLEAAEVALEVLMPTGPGPDLDRVFDKKSPDRLRVRLAEKDAFKNRLNMSGWFDEEIVAAGMLTQGRAQSLLSMMTGWALVEMARARRSKSLPREFCLALTPTRVIALAMSPWSEGSDDGGSDVVVKVKREEVGSWSRGSLRIEIDDRKLKSGMKGGMLHLAGAEQFPVNWGNGTDTEELIELLARG